MEKYIKSIFKIFLIMCGIILICFTIIFFLFIQYAEWIKGFENKIDSINIEISKKLWDIKTETGRIYRNSLK